MTHGNGLLFARMRVVTLDVHRPRQQAPLIQDLHTETIRMAVVLWSRHI